MEARIILLDDLGAGFRPGKQGVRGGQPAGAPAFDRGSRVYAAASPPATPPTFFKN
jgi:hypothetical protein